MCHTPSANSDSGSDVKREIFCGDLLANWRTRPFSASLSGNLGRSCGSLGSLTVDPADLGVALALVASFRDKVIEPTLIALGEIGLGGQIRAVSHLDLRLKEAAKLGFKQALIPKGQVPSEQLGLKITPVAKIFEAIVAALPPPAQSD